MIAATMKIAGKVRRLEEHADRLWYLVYAGDQAQLGRQGKPYIEWYKESDDIKFPKPKSTMCYS